MNFCTHMKVSVPLATAGAALSCRFSLPPSVFQHSARSSSSLLKRPFRCSVYFFAWFGVSERCCTICFLFVLLFGSSSLQVATWVTASVVPGLSPKSSSVEVSRSVVDFEEEITSQHESRAPKARIPPGTVTVSCSECSASLSDSGRTKLFLHRLWFSRLGADELTVPSTCYNNLLSVVFCVSTCYWWLWLEAQRKRAALIIKELLWPQWTRVEKRPGGVR